MRTFFFLAFCFLAIKNATAQNYFQPVRADQIPFRPEAVARTLPTKFHTWRLDFNNLQATLKNAPWENAPNLRATAPVVFFPSAAGDLEPFRVWKVDVVESEILVKHPEMVFFGGESLKNGGKTIRGSWTVRGLSAIILRADLGAEFVEPYVYKQQEFYLNYDRKDFPHLHRKTSLSAP